MLTSNAQAKLSLLVHMYVQFVDDLLATLASFRPELQELLQQLQDQMQLTAQASQAEAAKFSSGGKGTTATRKQTVPEPFNLTQSKPKLLPIEEPLPPPIKYCLRCQCTRLQCCLAAYQVRLLEACLCADSCEPDLVKVLVRMANRSNSSPQINQSQLNIIKLPHIHLLLLDQRATSSALSVYLDQHLRVDWSEKGLNSNQKA